MFGKFQAWLDKINETYYNIGYIAIVIVVGILAIMCGFGTAEVLLGILLKSVTYTVSAITFLKAAMGPKIDVMKKIADEQNSALAIIIGSFLIGLGACLGGI